MTDANDIPNTTTYNDGAYPPNINDMTEAQKKEVVGKCCFSFLFLFCSVAFICGLYANAYCDFASREIIYKDGFDVNSACEDLGFTDPGYEAICQSLFSEHGVGFYGWYGTVPVDTQVCFDYTLPIPEVGLVTPEFDTKFNSAKAFAITANVLGAFAWFTLAFSTCCKLDQERLQAMNCYFFCATLFQGLALILYRSDICEPGFFDSYFPNTDVADTYIEDVNCGLGLGAKFAITATVFYFVCNTVTPICIVPEPVPMCGSRRSRMGARDVDAEAAADPEANNNTNVPRTASETEEA